jgi:ammonia channel protein AmtB
MILIGSWLIFLITEKIAPIPVSAEQEKVGLDLSQHDELIKGFG